MIGSACFSIESSCNTTSKEASVFCKLRSVFQSMMLSNECLSSAAVRYFK
ncbi:unnamed protein product [Haemonchus placei]|uniref:Uncharacterized protein n=1 Tax=Haemonchus placei TaxID=6290 RepID=A0A3P8BEG7_HAEPC|nr:unnamed protein product [Haemonchus placei]